jgi:hypothetical protein
MSPESLGRAQTATMMPQRPALPFDSIAIKAYDERK